MMFRHFATPRSTALATLAVFALLGGAMLQDADPRLLCALAVLAVIGVQVTFMLKLRRERDALHQELQLTTFRSMAGLGSLAKVVPDQLIDQLNNEQVVAVIGRGHSGTRAISLALQSSGVFMGSPLNRAGDLAPRYFVVECSRMLSPFVKYRGSLQWDFSDLHTAVIDPAFKPLLGAYLASLIRSDAPRRGWKLPETNLIYPWLVRCLPNIKYIHWIRDPRDSLLARHDTDNLADYGVPVETDGSKSAMRAASWKYQYDIVRETPPPRHQLQLRFDDFVLDHQRTIDRLSEFLGISVASVKVRPDRVGVWKRECPDIQLPGLESAMQQLGYL